MTQDSKEFQEKLAKAINMGFIQISRDRDGMMHYTLTQAGMDQWKKEKPNGPLGGFQGFDFRV